MKSEHGSKNKGGAAEKAATKGTGGWGPPRRGARAIGQFVEDLTRPAFAKYGFSAAVILTQWAAIVGPELASYTRPERLKWPKTAEVENDDDGERRDDYGGSRQGALLILRASGPRSVEIQHRSHELMERVNASFGYRAVTRLRIIQAPVDRQSENRWRLRLQSGGRCVPAKAKALKSPPSLNHIENERLRAALERMAKGVAARTET
jgi:hypothetical protein